MNREEASKTIDEIYETTSKCLLKLDKIVKANKQSQQEKIEKVRKEAAESLLQIHNKTAQNIMNISKEGENE